MMNKRTKIESYFKGKKLDFHVGDAAINYYVENISFTSSLMEVTVVVTEVKPQMEDMIRSDLRKRLQIYFNYDIDIRMQFVVRDFS